MNPLYKDIQIDKIVIFAGRGGEVFFFLVMVLYLVFAFVLIRRVRLMNLNLRTPNARVFTLLANIHFIAAFIVVLLTFFSIK